jgi:hypothetical protein
MEHASFELIFLRDEIFLGVNLDQGREYLLFGENEGRSEEMAVLIEAGDDGFEKVIGPE